MHTWHWRTWQDLPYLTCSLLEPWSHGFLTREFWPRPLIEIAPVLHPELRPHRAKQVHGNSIVAVEDLAEESDELLEADGVFVSGGQYSVWVCTADCTPALIADTTRGSCAAIHAGWRGTAAKILPEAIRRFLNTGSRLEDLRVALGPSISGDMYQVSEDVASQVALTVAQADLALRPDAEAGKIRLDIRKVQGLQLAQLGLQADQIAIAPHCTYSEPERFFSYRRDSRKQVQWSGIVSTELSS
ncbi:peptidoglycan editing factor PgeF [Leptolyngbya sp. FACHB-261]|uniref:peptidoglycan editing factor PgeF n=1 Tax=Leptolyngbya sp. FACHB-261 TaxID=2692806 RepID=UPI001681C50C|nr:peptidoglycan editing factor PgeF [Leptolyngbya sp. FACHB-261]MBD2105014.1 peptidoglycan editing factor PgeF [Leptolyngbya sp. FACHB-261]